MQASFLHLRWRRRFRRAAHRDHEAPGRHVDVQHRLRAVELDDLVLLAVDRHVEKSAHGGLLLWPHSAHGRLSAPYGAAAA